MVKTGLVATLLAAAVAAAPSSPSCYPTENFQLEAKLRHGGPARFEGQYIEGFHTGAGTSDLVATAAPSDGQTFNLTSGYLQALLGSPPSPFRVALNSAAPANSGAPSEYKLTTFGVDAATSGFSIVDNKGVLTVTDDASSFKTFVLCNVTGIAPYYSVGPQTQLLWASSFHEAAEDSQCADVLLHAVA